MRQDSRRSYTAEGAAALRAAGARDARPAMRNPDHFAERLISGKYRIGVRVPPVRALLLAVTERRLPGLYLFVTARTKHLDTVLLEEIREGARQVVIVGAGADSRAYRFPDELADVPVFEFDHPATGAWKRSRIRRVLGSVPTQVRYAPVEFSTESLDTALDAAGVRRDLPTVILWEGVAPYLEPEAVNTTLATIAGFAAGSSVVFDYFYRDFFDDPCPYPEGPRYLRYLAAHSEPLVSGLDPAKLADQLTGLGLELVSDLGPSELAQRYLAGTALPVTSFSAIAHARVPG